MALIQLVHAQAPGPGAATTEIFDLALWRDPQRGGAQDFPGWGKKVRYEVPRQADLIRHIYLSLKLAPAPQGYRWKRLLPLHFIKSLKISIGGSLYWSCSSHTLQMQYRIHGFQTKPAWSPVPVDPEPEVLFDFSAEERTRRSQEPVEIFFEPIEFASFGQHMIPILCMPFHSVYFDMEIAKIEECLEWIADRPAQPIPAHEMNNYMLDCKLRGEYVFLNNPERQDLARGLLPEAVNTHTKHFEYCSEVFQQDQGHEFNAYINAYGKCTSAYIWITDEANKDLDRQIVDSFDILFNGNNLRETLTGNQSRFGLRDKMLHPVVPNNRSQNLYYINYSSGRLDEDGFQQACNFSRIDTYTIKFRLNQAAPQRFKIHMLHRTQNFMTIGQGMASLRYVIDPFSLSQAPFPEPVRVPVRIEHNPAMPIAPRPFPVFENTHQLIDVVEDKKQCMISYTDFQENDPVYMCLTCLKIFGAEPLEQWLKARPEGNRKCVHCQAAFTKDSFLKGKAHLVDEARPFVRPVPRQEGLLHRVLGVFVGR